jgi:hypothetical protein
MTKKTTPFPLRVGLLLDSGSEPFPADTLVGLSVRRHVSHLSGDYSLIVYHQNDKINFKQILIHVQIVTQA